MFRPQIVRLTTCNLQQACEYLVYGWRPMRDCDEIYDVKNDRINRRRQFMNRRSFIVQTQVICQALKENYIYLWTDKNGQKIKITNWNQAGDVFDIIWKISMEGHKLLRKFETNPEGQNLLKELRTGLKQKNLYFLFSDLKKLKNYKTFGIDNVYDVYIIGNCVFLEKPDASLHCIRVLKDSSVDIVLRYIIEKEPDTLVDVARIEKMSGGIKVNRSGEGLKNILKEFFDQVKNYSPDLTDDDITALKTFFVYKQKQFKFVSEPDLIESESE